LIYIHDFEGKFLDANDAALHLLGYTREEMPSLSFKNLLSLDQQQKATDQILQILEAGGQSEFTEYQLRTKDGKSLFVELSESLLYHDGKPYAMLGVGRDNTERKKYIEELTIAQAENTNLINSISSIIIGVSTKNVITHWNRMAEETFGISADNALGNNISGFKIQWDWNKIYVGISACLSENSPILLEDIKFVDRNGLEGILGITINPIKGMAGEFKGFLIYGKNVTDKRLMEQQLQQSSKMATIGEIATGIAHELNQPLNVIKMASQYLGDSVKDKYYTEEFIMERVDKIIAQVDRAARIITHLREFGRKSDFVPRAIDANIPIRMAFDLLGEQLRLHSIKVNMDLDPSLPPINGDSQKLEQVFINLIVNAKDALEENRVTGRENVICVKSFRRDPDRAIQIEFSDNGPGIPAHVIDKIFDPFFTTKEVGKGTGLGLSISYGIIKTHQGTIDVKPGSSGATFVIQLPAYDKSLDLLQETG
jgi:histidine kinase